MTNYLKYLFTNDYKYTLFIHVYPPKDKLLCKHICHA